MWMENQRRKHDIVTRFWSEQQRWKDNVVTTLLRRCPTLRPKGNQNPTLSQRSVPAGCYEIHQGCISCRNNLEIEAVMTRCREFRKFLTIQTSFMHDFSI